MDALSVGVKITVLSLAVIIFLSKIARREIAEGKSDSEEESESTSEIPRTSLLDFALQKISAKKQKRITNGQRLMDNGANKRFHDMMNIYVAMSKNQGANSESGNSNGIAAVKSSQQVFMSVPCSPVARKRKEEYFFLKLGPSPAKYQDSSRFSSQKAAMLPKRYTSMPPSPMINRTECSKNPFTQNDTSRERKNSASFRITGPPPPLENLSLAHAAMRSRHTSPSLHSSNHALHSKFVSTFYLTAEK